MTRFIELGEWQALFDRAIDIRGVRFAPPGDFELFQAEIEAGLSPVGTEDAAGRHVSFASVGGVNTVVPDEVFAQCGIQFRLRSVISIIESDPELLFFENPDVGAASAEACTAINTNSRIENWAVAGVLDEHVEPKIFFTADGEAVRDENGDFVRYGTTHSREVLYGTPGPNDGKVLVMALDVCKERDRLGRKEFFGLASGNVAAVEVRQTDGRPPALVAHELGHTLGNPANHGGNGDDSSISVNCAASASVRVGGCSTWRDDGVAPVAPYNCVDDLDDNIIGDLQAFLSCPGRGMFKSYLGYQALSEDSLVAFELNDEQTAALADERARWRLELALNTAGGTHVLSDLSFE